MTDARADRAKPVIAHSLDHAMTAAQAAAALRQPLALLSAPACASGAGTGWFTALGDIVGGRFPDLPVILTLDCGGDPGLVLGALRRGLKSVVFTGDKRAASRLAEIAAAYGAELRLSAPPALDLLDLRDPNAACRAWMVEEEEPRAG